MHGRGFVMPASSSASWLGRVQFVKQQINILLHVEHFRRLAFLDLVVADAPPPVVCLFGFAPHGIHIGNGRCLF